MNDEYLGDEAVAQHASNGALNGEGVPINHREMLEAQLKAQAQYHEHQRLEMLESRRRFCVEHANKLGHTVTDAVSLVAAAKKIEAYLNAPSVPV